MKNKQNLPPRRLGKARSPQNVGEPDQARQAAEATRKMTRQQGHKRSNKTFPFPMTPQRNNLAPMLYRAHNRQQQAAQRKEANTVLTCVL